MAAVSRAHTAVVVILIGKDLMFSCNVPKSLMLVNIACRAHPFVDLYFTALLQRSNNGLLWICDRVVRGMVGEAEAGAFGAGTQHQWKFKPMTYASCPSAIIAAPV